VAHDAVLLFFGVKWIGAVPALQLMLCLWVVRATRMLVNAIMIVEGRQRVLVIFGAIGLVVTAVAFALSLPFGERWTTISYAATLFGMIFGGPAFARQTGIDIGVQLRAGLVPIVFAVIMWGAVAALRSGPLAGLAPVPQLGAEVAAGAGVFIALALVFDRPGINRLRKLAVRR
jgi:O-antigen/teichoic acid export membrane protein